MMSFETNFLYDTKIIKLTKKVQIKYFYLTICDVDEVVAR